MRLLGITIVLFTGMVFAQSSVEKFTPQLDAVISSVNQDEKVCMDTIYVRGIDKFSRVGNQGGSEE